MTHALGSAEIGSAWKFHRDRYEPKTRAEVRAIALARVDYGGQIARPKGMARKLEIQVARASVAAKCRNPEAIEQSRATRELCKLALRGLRKSNPAPEPVLGPVPKPAVVILPPPPPKPANPDCQVPRWRRDTNQRKHLLSLAKMMYRPFVPTLDQCCDIFAIFGDYDSFIAASRAPL